MPLEIHIQGFDITNLDARMQAMARPCYSALTNHAGDKPTIVFVPSKRHARQTAVDLWAYASAEGKGDKFLQVGGPCYIAYMTPFAVKSAVTCAVTLTVILGCHFCRIMCRLRGSRAAWSDRVVCHFSQTRAVCCRDAATADSIWSIDKHANVVLGCVVRSQQMSLDSYGHHLPPSFPLDWGVASFPIPFSNPL